MTQTGAGRKRRIDSVSLSPSFYVVYRQLLSADTSLAPNSGVHLHTFGDIVWVLVNLDARAIPSKKGDAVKDVSSVDEEGCCCVVS